MTFDGLPLPSAHQEKLLMLAKIGELKPIILSSEATGKNYGLLTFSSNLASILEDQPNGSWSLPVIRSKKKKKKQILRLQQTIS